MAYLTLAQARELNGLTDDEVYSDAELNEGIAWAKETIDDYCGTTFGDVTTPAYDAFTVTLDGNGRARIRLVDEEGYPILFPRTIVSATVDGETVTGTTYTLGESGIIARDPGVFSVSTYGRNVVITGTAGKTNTPPETIKTVCKALTRYWVLNLNSRTPDRALNLTTPEGSFEVRAQAGAPGRPTAMPDVNAMLNRYRYRWPI